MRLLDFNFPYSTYDQEDKQEVFGLLSTQKNGFLGSNNERFMRN